MATNVWQKRYSRENREAIGDVHEYIFVYASNPVVFKEQRNLIPLQEKQTNKYSNPDNDHRGPWQSVSLLAQGYRPGIKCMIVAPNGRRHSPPPGNCWKIIQTEYEKLISDNRVYFGREGNGVPRRKEFLSKAKGLVPWTWWPHEDVGQLENRKLKQTNYSGLILVSEHQNQSGSSQKGAGNRLLSRRLGARFLRWFRHTGAVAHKMGRRWIMVELGEHCHTHIIPRMKKVIDGTDQGGITKAVKWKGGGGFRYYRLAPSLLEKDKWGNWVINKQYNAAMLAEALCKLEGFVYAPSDSIYWQHGHSTERDFIYVTTQNLSHDQLQALNDEVGQSRSLLVLCSAFRGKSDRFPNLTIKKIPNAVLKRCEWGHDDYSLRVENLPKAPPKPGQLPLFGEEESHEREIGALISDALPRKSKTRQPPHNWKWLRTA